MSKRIITVVAKLNLEVREALRINQGGDGSLYVEPSSRCADAHVSLHASGVFQVTYEDTWMQTIWGRRKLRIALANGQPLSTFRGCESPIEHVIAKSFFGQMRKFNNRGTAVQVPVFSVDLGSFSSPLVRVTVFIFDQANLGRFKLATRQLNSPVSYTVMSIQPCVGLSVHG